MNNDLLTALIGFGGALVGALISGVVDLFTSRRAIKNAHVEFEATMKQTLEDRIKREKNELAEKVVPLLHGENERFYKNYSDSLPAIDRLMNELHYINNATHPNSKEKRSASNCYPHIANHIYEISSPIQWNSDISKLLGSLRYRIDWYNIAVDAHYDIETLEERISEIYQLVSPLYDGLFEQYSDISNALRKHEISLGKEIIERASN